MGRLLGHRQTKGAATDKPNLLPPRHISTLPDSVNSRGEGGDHRLCSRLSNAIQCLVGVTWKSVCLAALAFYVAARLNCGTSEFDEHNRLLAGESAGALAASQRWARFLAQEETVENRLFPIRIKMKTAKESVLR